jgi:tetratricopeptide (TPR) repeat protein
VGALTELSLVRPDPFDEATPGVKAHRLVQLVAQGRAERLGIEARSISRIITRLSALYPRDDFESSKSMLLSDQLAPHVLELCVTDRYRAASNPGKYAALLHRVANSLFAFGAYSEAWNAFQNALAINQRVTDVEVNTASILHDMANLQIELNELTGAQTLLERALDWVRKSLGLDHPFVGAILRSLGRVLERQRDLRGARALFERAFNIGLKTLGPNHPDMAVTLADLGRVILGYRRRRDSSALFL